VLEVAGFDGFVPGGEDEVVPVHIEPDDGDVRAAVFSNGGNCGRPGLFY
jgi:hypothetical protein